MYVRQDCLRRRCCNGVAVLTGRASSEPAAEDFRGKRIGCFRVEAGNKVIKSWLRENGVVNGEDVEFVMPESSAAEVAAVENGEVDRCFVNSGYGYVAEQGARYADELHGVKTGLPGKVVCRHFDRNKKCRKEDCPLFPSK